MKLVYEFELSSPSPSNNTIKGMHIHVYRKLRQDYAKEIAALVGVIPQPIQVAHLEIDRYSSGALDWDNVYGGLKPVFDSLVSASVRNPSGLGLIANDDPQCVPSCPIVRQFKCKRGEGKTVVRIYAV